MKSSLKDSDINIELFRIICCVFVLCNHIISSYVYTNSGINYLFAFFGTLNRMAVPGFFMITGYFLFRKEKSYKYILKKSLYLFLPALIVIILTQVFDLFLYNQMSFIGCLKSFNFDGFKTLKCILNFSSDICKNTQFLFFVFEYIQLLLLYPIFKLICKDNNNCKKVRKYLIIYTLISQLLIPNICEFIPDFSVSFPQLIRIKYMYVLIGYDIYLYYKNNTQSIEKRIKILCLFVYIIMGIIQTVLFYYKNKFYPANTDSHFMTSEVFNVFFSTISLFLLFRNSDFSSFNKYINSIIKFVSKQTYGIYLVHWMVMVFIFSSGLKQILLDSFGIISSFNIVFICFVISFFIVVLFKFVIYIIRFFIKKLKKAICE